MTTQSPTTVTRQSLYEQVWATPLRKLAEAYGVSDVALAKVCRKLNVPVPGRGHWAKVAAGHPVRQRALPRTAKQQSATISPVRRRPESPPEERIPHPETVASIGPIEVIAIDRPHRLTARTRRHFLGIERRLARAARRRKSAPAYGTGEWPPIDDHGRYHCSGQDGFPLTVSLPALERALCILDALAKALESRGFRFIYVEPNRQNHGTGAPEGLCVTRQDERFRFLLREGYRRRERSAAELAEAEKAKAYLGRFESTPNNSFTFELHGSEYGIGEVFRDSRSVKLETLLGQVVAAFVDAVPRQQALRAERETKERNRRLAERMAWEERERVRKDTETLEALLQEAERGRQFQVLRDYLKELERAVCDDGELSDAGGAWLAKVRDLIERYDPARRRLRGEAPL